MTHARTSRIVALLLVAALVTLAPARQASAIGTGILVTTNADNQTDDGQCTLREAMQSAFSTPPNDDCGVNNPAQPIAITFGPNATGKTIKLTGGVLPFVNRIAVITGPVIIDGSYSNIITVASGGNLSVANLTLTKGQRAITINDGTFSAAGVSFLGNGVPNPNISGDSGSTLGGAISASGPSAKVNIAGSLFTGNRAPADNGTGGAIHVGAIDKLNIAGTIFTGNQAEQSGGAIYSTAPTNLTDCIFNGNIADGLINNASDDDNPLGSGGGAVWFQASEKDLNVTRGVFNGNLSPNGSGGALFIQNGSGDTPTWAATIRDSSFNGNIAGKPTDHKRYGGAILNIGIANIQHTTLLNNAALGSGGAIANDRNGRLTISNSTLVANAASENGAGLLNFNSQQGSNIRPVVNALHVTFALNAAKGQGGGMFGQPRVYPNEPVTIVSNSIVSGSDGPNLGGNCASDVAGQGRNLDSGTSCGFPADQSGLDAKLGPPALNGGPIPTLLTMKPGPGSAAADAADATICAAAPVSARDQTDKQRPQGPACDLGALENDAAKAGFGASPVQPGPIQLGSSTVGTPIDASLAVFNTGDAPLTIASAQIGGANAADFAVASGVPITIAPGAAQQPIGLRCTPSVANGRSATLTLSTNDPARASVSFNLLCTGTATPVPGFGSTPASPGSLDFGTVLTGGSATRTIVVRETGTAPLTLSGAAIGGADAVSFVLQTPPPATIANGGAEAGVLIRCAPSAPGVKSATLSFATNDPATPTASYILVCTAKTPPQPPLSDDGGSTTSLANNPYGLALSPDGASLYVANQGSSRLVRYAVNPDGSLGGGLSYTDGSLGGNDLGGAWMTTVSPDGKNVYVAAQADDAVTSFSRDPETGALTLIGSLKQGDRYGLCFPSPCQAPFSFDSLATPYSILISPDGRFGYVSAVGSDAINVLYRNSATGELTISGRSGPVQVVQPGVADLNGAYGIALSPDGAFLYATGYSSDTLLVYARNPVDGKLSFVQKLDAAAVPALDGVFRATVSPDGATLYAASFNSSAVTSFSRNAATGQLTPLAAATDGAGGVSGIGNASAVAVSPDGSYLYATGYGSDSLAVFGLEADGTQTFAQAIVRDAGGQPPLGGARDVAVAPNGRTIYATGYSDGAVVWRQLPNPVPRLQSLDPASRLAASAASSVTLNGQDFVEGAIVRFDASAIPTTFINSGKLTAVIPAAIGTAVGTHTITVVNPAPGGGASNGRPFVIGLPDQNPVPSIQDLSPQGALAGGPALTVTLIGSGFLPGTSVSWNGAQRAASYISASALQIQVSAAEIAQPGAAVIAASNPAPGGGTSPGVVFTIAAPGSNPAPTIGQIAPSSITAGSLTAPELVVRVLGSGFVPGIQARWNGEARPTIYIGSTEARLSLSASDLTDAGSAAVTVETPGPGGGMSQAASFTIGAPGSNPTPSIAHIGAAPGPNGTITITIDGTDFVAGALVRWNGVNKTPTSVSATAIVLSLPASEYRSASVAVVNLGPGGGSSADALYQIVELRYPLVRS